jgi:hypothetical protein
MIHIKQYLAVPSHFDIKTIYRTRFVNLYSYNSTIDDVLPLTYYGNAYTTCYLTKQRLIRKSTIQSRSYT